MISAPKLSVIIPVYNAEKHLKQCLDSVINQTMHNIEIICVDDGSTDDSLNILKEYHKKDSRIVILTQQNLQAGVARNTGLTVAKGEYIHFLDADDWIEKTAYKEWYAIAKDQDTDVCFCFYNKFDNETKEFIKVTNKLSDEYISESNFKKNPQYFIYNEIAMLCNKIYRIEFLQKHNISFDDLMCVNDRSFYFRCLHHAELIIVIQEYWLNHRHNKPEFLVETTRQSQSHFDCRLSSFKTIWELLSPYKNDIKRMMLDITIEDFLNFYRTLDEKNKTVLREQLGTYLRGIDLSLFEYNISQYKWCKEYLELTEFDKLLDVNEREQLQNYINAVHLSWSYRIGLAVTFPMRKFYDILKYLREHGISYIFKHYAKEIVNCFDFLKKKPIEHKTQKTQSPRVIVSLTSFPARIRTTHKVITTLLTQSLKPDMLILWLSQKDFPLQEKELPNELLKLTRNGLSIRWCEDLGSYKKLIPALKEYPEDIIVTAEDNILYPENWLELLYNSYKKELGMFVHCHMGTKLFCPNDEWHSIFAGRSIYPQPSYLHIQEGLGGCLYPPHVLHTDVLKTNLLKELALSNDDIWFWLMTIRNNIKIKVIKECISTLLNIEESQDDLEQVNNHDNNSFWKDFDRVLEHYPDIAPLLKCEYELMHKIELSKRIPYNEKDLDYYSKLSPDYYLAELMLWYHQVTQMYLNLDNPKTFNEKIQWMKLYDSTEQKTRLADKYLVRDWVAEKIGNQYLIPLLGVWDSFDEINFDSFPERFVLKANHGCGWNIIVKDKATFDIDDAKAKFDVWMSKNYAFHNLELHYKNIKPKIIAEQFLENENDDLYDYKLFCFNGKTKYIAFYCERAQGIKMAYYDTAWNLQPFIGIYPRDNKIRPKPTYLDELIRISDTLSMGFPHVRIDFYILNNGEIKFGEMTFSPASGTVAYNPPEYNLIMGDLIDLSIVKKSSNAVS